jgi:hypothetical protein
MADSLFTGLTNVISDAVSGAEPTMVPVTGQATTVGQDLLDLRAAAAAIDTAADIGAWSTAVEAWFSRLGQLATDAFSANAMDELFTRFLQARFPRVAAVLALAGVIKIDANGAPVVDWQALEAFIKDPGQVANEQLWDDLFEDVGGGGNSGPHVLAVLVGSIIMAPRTITALDRGTLKVGALPPAPTRATTGVWHDFRQTSSEWVSLTIPLGDPAKVLELRTPQTLFDTVSDLQPDIAATLALRSDRRVVGAAAVSDFELWLSVIFDGDDWRLSLGDGWFLRVEPGLDFGFGYDGTWHGAFRPGTTGTTTVPPPGQPVSLQLGRDPPAGAPDILVGPPYDTHLVVQDLGAFLRVRETEPVFEIGGFVHGLALVVASRWLRTFGSSAIPAVSGLRFDLDFELAYAQGQGVRFNLTSGFQVTFHLNLKLGGDSVNIKLRSVTLKLPIEAGGDPAFKIRLEARTLISGTLGPVVLVLNGAGAWIGVWKEGPHPVHYGALAPTGGGVQITAQGVTGGGFFNYDEGPPERYSGALALKIAGSFDVSAFGIYEKTPLGKISLVVVIGVRFTPGIQLGYGIAIAGFGGLLGINRRADTDALRLRICSGTAGNLLFPDDPINNAPEILDDLQAFLPAADGVYVFGPTAQLTWIKLGGGFQLVTVSLGIFIELPGPTKIILVGVVRIAISTSSKAKDALLQIRLDLIGVLDFTKKTLEFDASLVESQLLQVFQITGDAAFRLGWGDQPYIALTIGGFHPDYNPAPMQFPKLERLAMTYGSKDNAYLTMRGETYFAVTTNTLQFGTHLEMGLKALGLEALGWVSLDVLIQFSPFHFSAALEAGFAVRFHGISLASVTLRGSITGPGPIVISGSLHIELLFFDVSWQDTFTLGEAAAAAAAAVSSVVQALQSELTENSNLSGDGGDDVEVIRQAEASDDYAVVSPLGRLAWSQRRVPLDTLVERFENVPLETSQSVHLQVAGATDSVREWFSPGSFTSLNQSEALNRASFDRLPGGVVFGFGSAASDGVPHTVGVVTYRLPQRVVVPHPASIDIPAVVLEGIVGRARSAKVADRDSKVQVAREKWSVRGTDGSPLGGGLSETEAHQRARQKGAVATPDSDLVDVGAV